MGRAVYQHAAIVIIRADMFTLVFGHEHARAGMGVFIQACEFLFHRAAVGRGPRHNEAASFAPFAVDVFVLDEAFDGGETVGGIREQKLHFILRIGAGIAFADGDTARHHAAIAGGTTKARHLRIQHDAVMAVAGQFKGSRKPGIAGTDDAHAGGFGHIGLGRIAHVGVVSIPPEGALLVGFMEDVLAHDQRPFQTGSRFSAKALAPSSWSSLE